MKKLFTLLSLLLTIQAHASSALNFGNLGVTAAVKAVAWSGTIDADDRTFLATTGATGDFGAGTTVTSAEVLNNGFGTVTCGGSSLPQCVFSNIPESGPYQVCYNASASLSANGTGGVLLADGSNNIVVYESSLAKPNANYHVPVGGCGLVNLTKGAAYTLKLRGSANVANIGIEEPSGTGAQISLSIIKIGGGGGTVSDWISDNSFITVSAGFGTIANKEFYRRDVGDELCVRGNFQTGTVAATAAELTLSGYTIDFSKLAGTSNTLYRVGMWNRLESAATSFWSQGYTGFLIVDGSANTKIYFSDRYNSDKYEATTANSVAANARNMNLDFCIPVN